LPGVGEKNRKFILALELKLEMKIHSKDFRAKEGANVDLNECPARGWK
jgi:hypothetical protein